MTKRRNKVKRVKRSLQYQYTFVSALVIAAILFALWCANNLFLEPYYIQNKSKILKKTYDRIERMLVQNQEDGITGLANWNLEDEQEPDNRDQTAPGSQTDEIRKAPTGAGEDRNVSQEGETEWETPENALLRELGEKYNISIYLTDNQEGTYLSTDPRGGRAMSMQIKEFASESGKPDPAPDERPRARRERIERAEILEQGDSYTIQKMYNRFSNSYYLQSYGQFLDGRISFLMSVPLASIRESVELSNRFLTAITLLALVIGSIVLSLTMKRITNPILQLSELSEQMSKLNFDARYKGNRENEIGVLGNSMNVLSQRLKETMEELKTANARLQSDIEQKERIDEMRKDFISNVSHELKTPITIIHGYAEGLADGMCRDEESRSFYYQVILNESDKMGKMVKQLLNLSSLEFGFDPPQMEEFDICELIEAILSSAQVMLREKEAAVRFEPETPILVRADEFKVEEVLSNYFSNALNHLEGERIIEVRAEELADYVKVTVFNTGKQIPEKELPELWTKFYKVDKAHTREYGGSGIGLSIVKAVMDSHNRECGVQNTADGVEFWFTLDRAKDRAKERDTGQQELPPNIP